ncbi:rab effector MyRIP isoform X1 [Dasypus novemcinctus]|uniref:rab effector MyRIP isoform X1 n=2 Tax=Dasypus novemcinctus TaxID=9361 RepID=UPI0039C95CC8
MFMKSMKKKVRRRQVDGIIYYGGLLRCLRLDLVMGRKLDLSGLTDDETEHILQVVQRDFNLRKKEEERLSEMKQRLEEEGSKCSILARHQQFVEHCCMRCCAPFTFLVNTRRLCGDCRFNVCKGCCSYQKREKAWLCHVCQQARLLRTQSLEWFYSNVKSRFKRFGSAKVLQNLCRKHRLESGACFDLPGGSLFEANPENEGSISGSDSTFYRQSEGHSMMDTLAVALRVAEEAIEDAISKAEASGDSLDKQNEASYLRGHKDELTEELATTILQKIIRKQKNRSEQPADEPTWMPPPRHSAQAAGVGSAASAGGHRAPAALWRSQSAISLTGEDAWKPSAPEAAWGQPRARGQLPGWRSMDRLDAAGDCHVAPGLQGPNGSCCLKDDPRPPTHPESSTSRAPAAHDEGGSDSEEDFGWSEALRALRPRPQGPLGKPRPAQPRAPVAASPCPAPSPNPEATCSDSGTSSAGSPWEAGHWAAPSWPQRKPPRNPAAERRRPPPELDVNFNPQAAGGETSDSSGTEEAPPPADRRARRWRRARAGAEEPSGEPAAPGARPRALDTPQVPGDLAEAALRGEARPSAHAPEERLRSRLYALAPRVSEKETSSGEEQESEPRTGSETQKESLSSEDNSQSVQEELWKKYSAVSLCTISTEVLKVINATEELIAQSTGPLHFPPAPPGQEEGAFPPGTDQVRLDEQLTSLEENVYLAAGPVYGLEGQLAELEDAARRIHSGTAETELAALEDQVATAAAQVHRAELQISDIESRISALTVAGLNIAPCGRLTRRRGQRPQAPVQTLDSSRQQRRRLPAPPAAAEKAEASPGTAVKTFNRSFLLQGSSTARATERRRAEGLTEPTLESAVMY